SAALFSQKHGALDKIMLSFTSYAAEVEQEKARLRSRDAREPQVHRCRRRPATVREYIVRDILPDEAAVIRRIFREVADGRGFARIAQGLNADAIPSPAHGRGWATSGVREFVLRDL